MAGGKHQEVRVIAGTLKGRVLLYPAGVRVRPTMQRTKASVFDSLARRIQGSVFVDLYAGAGGVGIEALSRGARGVHFVENDAEAVRCLRENLSRCDVAPGLAEVHAAPVIDFLKSGALRGIGPGVVWADPPYDAGELRVLLEFFAGIEYALDVLLVVEHRREALRLDGLEGLSALEVRRYGQSCVSYIALGGEGP